MVNKDEYNPTFALNVRELRNVRAFQEIGVEEHDGDVPFRLKYRNMAVSCKRNEKYAI